MLTLTYRQPCRLGWPETTVSKPFGVRQIYNIDPTKIIEAIQIIKYFLKDFYKQKST